jgi:WD40 repeat protein
LDVARRPGVVTSEQQHPSFPGGGAPAHVLAQPGLFLAGHKDKVEQAIISPDGQRILSASVDGALILWDLETGNIVRQFEPTRSYLSTIAFLPDGHRALSGGSDKIIRLWDVDRGRVVRELRGHTEWVLAVAPSPDGRLAYSTSGGRDPWSDGSDTAVRVWDLRTGLQVGMLPGHTGRTCGLAVSKDGSRILTSGSDRKVILWNAKTGELIHEMLGHTDIVESVAFLPDGKGGLSGSADATIRVWDLRRGRQMDKFVGLTHQALWLSVTEDGRYLLSGDYTGHELRLWDVPEHRLIQTLSLGRVYPTRGCFSPDGQHVAWPGSDRIVRLYRFADYDPAKSAVSAHGAIEAKSKPLAGKSSGPRKPR